MTTYSFSFCAKRYILLLDLIQPKLNEFVSSTICILGMMAFSLWRSHAFLESQSMSAAMWILAAPGVTYGREILSGTDLTYVAQQITRMEAAVNADPGLAIGTAKELIETCCKTIFYERGVTHCDNTDLPGLVKLTSKELKLTPDDISDQAKAADLIKRLLSNLATIAQGVAELRNKFGTRHGKLSTAKGLGPRHAKLAVGAASTLAVFLVETHHQKSGK